MTDLENILNQVVENSRIEFYLVNDEDQKLFLCQQSGTGEYWLFVGRTLPHDTDGYQCHP